MSAAAWSYISDSYYKRITDFIKKAERNPDILNTTKTLPADYGAMSVMTEMLTKSFLMGIDRATRKKEFAEPTVEEIETLPYAEAVEYLKKRDVIDSAEYYNLADKLKFRAFTASRISDGALLKRINGELIKSIESGEGLKAFLEMTKTDLLNKVGLGTAGGWYWETVYRTNVQTAYNAGRMMGYEQDKPYALELVVIDDARTTDFCRQFAGKGFILPYSDPFWKTHIPPFHFNCRTTVRAIYDEREIPEQWSSKADIEAPAKGFGNNPVVDDSWWKELSSQVRQAKMYGVQGEIEAAEELLIHGQMKSVSKLNKTTDNIVENMKIKIEKVDDEIAGVKRGTPMTFAEADNGNANPNYKPLSPTSDNCPACVLSMKARLDGFNIQAKAFDKTSSLMFTLSENTNFGLIDKVSGTFPEYIKPREKYMPRLLSWFDKTLENDKYYSIEFYWKDFTPDGHIMMITKHDTKLMLYDPQTDEKIEGGNIKNFLYTVRLGTIKLMNLSNCFLNKTVVDYVLEARL